MFSNVDFNPFHTSRTRWTRTPKFPLLITHLKENKSWENISNQNTVMSKKTKLPHAYCYKSIEHDHLNLVEGNNVTALDPFIAWLNSKALLNKSIHRHKIINNSEHDLELLYPITNGHQFCCINSIEISMNQKSFGIMNNFGKAKQYIGKRNHTCTPEETLHFNTSNSLFKLLHVSLIVPRLYIQKN